jgi:hypothetical protein
MRNLVSISQEGENVVLELMNDGTKFGAYGVFTKHILKQLAQRKRGKLREERGSTNSCFWTTHDSLATSSFHRLIRKIAGD